VCIVGGAGSGGDGLVGSWNETGATFELAGSIAGRAQAPLSRERGHSRVAVEGEFGSLADGGTRFTARHGSSSAAAVRDDKNTARVVTHHEIRLVMVPPSHP
jgi:hypothetical protein